MFNHQEISKKWQNQWKEQQAFVPTINAAEKFLITVPYPYISGSLHIGHARVVTEADVYARFLRMSGKNVLFPMGFHISGTPVLGISLAIKNGDEKKIALYTHYVKAYVTDSAEVERIVQSFIDPQKIVDFFIPKMVDEFSGLGLSIDWTRSFTSGDVEHQKLVEWQFAQYEKQNYLVRGEYPVLYSLSLENAVGEDDIADGDTDPVEKKEFTLIKFPFEDGFIVAATLRPETMYGQTNMWVHPDVTYIKARVGDEIWYTSRESLVKYQHQSHTVEELEEVSGRSMLGKTCLAPFLEKNIPILPSLHCDPQIASGIVTSVPGDAPFDFISLQMLQKDDALCLSYGLDLSIVKAISPVAIVRSSGFSDLAAEDVCKKLNITDVHDPNLTDATTQVYKAGHHTGVLLDTCGDYAGKSVADAKKLMSQRLLDEKRACLFYETNRKAVSRDGGQVIVAIMDGQWFLDFNAQGWKDKAKKNLEAMDIVPSKYRKEFEDIFEWLDKRPCARKRGLGTKLPQDPKWVIESLSDSTIYMALYPIVHIMRKHKIAGDMLTPDFFDYVFGKSEILPAIDSAIMNELRDSFAYWYPLDHRHTFTAHLSNHLSFMIFAHTACFGENFWPKKISFHGLVLSEGQKMSKSKGNVVSLLEMNQEYGPDTFRAYLCTTTAVESSMNWEATEAKNTRWHIEQIFNQVQELQSRSVDGDITGDGFTSKLQTYIESCTNNLQKMLLRPYATTVLYDIPRLVKRAMNTLTETELGLFANYASSIWMRLLAPLIPHTAEELWSKQQSDLVSLSVWPVVDTSLQNAAAEFGLELTDGVSEDVRAVTKLIGKEPKQITLIVADSWKYEFVNLLQTQLKQTRDPKNIIGTIMGSPLKQYGQQVMKLIPALLKDSSKLPSLVLSAQQEEDILKGMKFKCKLIVEHETQSKHAKARQAMPGKPAIVLD
ncbi:MAG: leucyl-tRNA synthetase [Candidatus Woesearchaeota archaeon]|jgi:leucyl-tRNA synthetase